jgi:uncharacterized repeat protein (TIGR01451 family)
MKKKMYTLYITKKLWQLITLLLTVMPGMARATMTNNTTNTHQGLKQRKPGVPLMLLLILSVLFTLLVTTPGVLAANGYFDIDFVAAAPGSYNHLTGGGAFDDRTIRANNDVVESLQGGDFSCGDIVTYLTEVTVDDTAQADTDAPQTIELNFSFLADTTGQSGVAIGDIVLVQVNYGTIEDLITGENSVDDGIYDDSGSTATLIYENLTGPLFQAGSELHGTVELDDLERNETVVVRIDVKLFCDPGSNPTGNLAGALTDARLAFINDTEPVDPPEAVPGGEQTIPFKQIGDICTPELEIQKTVNTSNGTCPGVETLTINAGDIVKYCYVVNNPSSCAPLYNVNLVDDNGTPGDTGDDFTVTLSGLTDVDNDGTVDDLNVSSTATGDKLVTINKVGEVINNATATGDDSVIEPTTLIAFDTAKVISNFLAAPSINLTKTMSANADEDESDDVSLNDTLTYTFNVTNDGNVNLDPVTVTDPMPGLSALSCDATSLAPGASMTCTATYTVTQADVDAGSIYNMATATGTPPTGDDVTDTDDEEVNVPQNPSIDLTKTMTVNADEDGTGDVSLGDTLIYTFSVTNDGNVNLDPVVVTDPMPGLSLISCGATSLTPGVSMTCTATYTVTQDDVNAGWINNTATATGTPPTGDNVTDMDDEEVNVPQTPSIDVEKYVSIDGGETWEDADDPIGPFFICYTDPQFKFVITNIGNVDLTGISLTDSDFDLSDCTVPPLAVGASFECFVTDPWDVIQHTDTANVTVDFGGETYFDRDDANYYYRAPPSQ